MSARRVFSSAIYPESSHASGGDGNKHRGHRFLAFPLNVVQARHTLAAVTRYTSPFEGIARMLLFLLLWWDGFAIAEGEERRAETADDDVNKMAP